MAFSAKIITDTITTNGRRATSMLVTLPQMIEQEFLRHRVFCCSFSSTRAIPMTRQIQTVQDDPFIPLSWGKSGKGMQAKEELDAHDARYAEIYWLQARDEAVQHTRKLLAQIGNPECLRRGVHKQIAGRLLQPFAWRTGIITATDWMNFFYLRVHPDAQPEIQYFAYLCLHAYLNSMPTLLTPGEWHLPFITNRELFELQANPHLHDEYGMVSAARCARNSYNRLPTPEEAEASMNGTDFATDYYVPDWKADLATAKKLLDGSGGIGHWSPFEHQLEALGTEDYYTKTGPYHGYRSLRSMIEPHGFEETVTISALRELMAQYEEKNPERKLPD